MNIQKLSRYENKIVIVTGSARGIGFAIARRFLSEGASVVLADVSGDELERAVVSLHEDLATNCIAVPADVSLEGDVTRLVEATMARFGRIDILVNNAGISPKQQGRKLSVCEIPLDQWRQVLDINLTGAFLCCKASLPHMISQQWGRIINMGSQAGRTRPDFAGAHYAASKAGIMALARTLATEVGQHGITVNSLAPGRIDTAMIASSHAGPNDQYTSRIPVGRLGTPEEVAAAAAYLASDEAGFITGVTLDVNGGVFMI